MFDRPILLLGARGQLGRALRPALNALGDVTVATRSDADLTDAPALRRLVRGVKPSLIVNAAAYTAVDAAEDDIRTAEKVNAEAPAILAEEAARERAGLLHYSTDYVFDGRGERPYRETDPTRPQTVYGRTKREGERAVLTVMEGHPHWILRTSWLYGPGGDHFVSTMLRLGKERGALQVVDDQIGAPTSALWLAEATARLVKNAYARDDHSATSALYHAVARGQTSWYGFARAIFHHYEMDVPVEPVSTEAFSRPAPRPAYSVLDTARLREAFGIEPSSWSRQLADAVPQLTASAS
jgi:dTDP-4-dehydrorhamnose reductase